ncbi:MAG: Fic family protein [Planctomycetota bacterium]|jgi:Fic family protein
MVFDPGKPYNDLPLLPPKADLETKAVLRKAVAAGRALAELKGVGETIPNQAILVDSLMLQEAKASSEIENIITTNDALFKAFAAQTKEVDPAVKEVLGYRRAVWDGFNALKKRPVLTTNLFVQLMQTIKENQAGIRKTPGTNLKNATTGKVVYTPPEGEAVIRDKLKNLEDYIHTEDGVDPLVKLAVIHYQFESIHPFGDGNGRTGRIINILYLILKNLMSFPVLYLSKHIIENKTSYYRLLREVTENGRWEPWVLYMLGAVESTSRFTCDRILAIRTLMEETLAKAKQELPSRVYSKELIELLFHQPYTKGESIVTAGIAKRQTAAEYLKELEKIGILESQQVGKQKLYLNSKLYVLLSS